MGILNPSNKELEDIGISRGTYISFDFTLARIGGVVRWKAGFSFIYFSTMALGFVTSVSFVFGAFRDGERDAALESIHFIPLLVNMMFQGAAYHYNQRGFLDIIRVFDRDPHFDYEDTLDEDTERELRLLKSEMKRRKQKFGSCFKWVLFLAFVGHSIRKPFSIILNGQWKNAVDGERDLIWNGVFGMLVPYSNYWAPYIFGIALSYATSSFVSLTATASMLAYQYVAEELISEYNCVAKTFNRSLKRAEVLHSNKRHLGEEITMEDCLERCLTLSVKHHLQTLRNYEKFQSLLSIPMFIMVFDAAVILCLSLYLIISDDVSMDIKLPMAVGIVAECVVMFTYCYYGELLKTAMYEIGDSVYECDKWAEHSKTLKIYIMMVKCYCNIPNELTAGGFAVLGHSTFADIMSTAYSYMGLVLSTK